MVLYSISRRASYGRSREISTPRDSGLDYSNRFEIGQASQRSLQHPISQPRDFTEFGGETSYPLVNRGPDQYQPTYLMNPPHTTNHLTKTKQQAITYATVGISLTGIKGTNFPQMWINMQICAVKRRQFYIESGATRIRASDLTMHDTSCLNP